MTTWAPTATTLKIHLYKACQRCGGDLMLDREIDFGALGASSDYVCLQCARRTPLSVVARALVPVSKQVSVAARTV